jgi:alkylation response protein AidB-like acyl-CoA dehydrogenase
MAHEFEEFHEELRSVAGDLLAKDRTVEWPVLADAGWTGLEVADHFGGSGATFGEVAIVCEEIGRAASATNYLGSGVLAAGLLNSLQPDSSRDELLTGWRRGPSGQRSFSMASPSTTGVSPVTRSSCRTPTEPTEFWWSPPTSSSTPQA